MGDSWHNWKSEIVRDGRNVSMQGTAYKRAQSGCITIWTKGNLFGDSIPYIKTMDISIHSESARN